MVDEMKDGDEEDVVAPAGLVAVEAAVLEALVDECIAEYGEAGRPVEQRAILLDLFGPCPCGHNWRVKLVLRGLPVLHGCCSQCAGFCAHVYIGF